MRKRLAYFSSIFEIMIDFDTNDLFTDEFVDVSVLASEPYDRIDNTTDSMLRGYVVHTCVFTHIIDGFRHVFFVIHSLLMNFKYILIDTKILLMDLLRQIP